ncbi:MAG: translational GTPase TypA, partial [Christensenellaceae bacterium]
FRDNQVVQERVMDNNDLERERGITILAKNTAVNYNGVKINVVDTPGHADFSGEVERVLKMVDGVILLVDAFEGPMPQTRFVLQKALEIGHKVITVINKMDRPDARLNEVGDEVLELLMDLDATEEQLDSPIIYCSGREGTATLDPNAKGENLNPLFDLIVSYIPAPQGNWEEPLQMLVSSIDYNEYVGRIAVGRIERGEIKQGQEVSLCDYHIEDLCTTGKVTAIYQYDGLKRIPVQSARAGDIIAFSGLDTVNIGNTICAPYTFEPIPFVKISEPTVEMTFSVNDSPFAGREGKFVTSRHLRERLLNELRKDVSLNVQETDSADKFRVLGRGEMHLSILIETMRREGYEFQVSTPKVLFKTINGQMCEPIERLLVDIPSGSVGNVIEKLGARKSEMVHMTPQGDRMRIEFLIPARGLFGYRSEFMTDTRGEGILNTVFSGYEEYKGDIDKRSYGSLIAFESGDAVIYGLYNAQERGVLFIGAPTAVYAGMVVGYSPKNEDLVVNVCKKKHISNVRASGSDDSLRLTTPKTMSLEEMLEFLGDDELLEVTPKNLRIRKRILDHQLRLRSNKK